MKNFRATEIRTSSPNVRNDSASSLQDTRAKRSMSTAEWTDEKHSMYLNSMEASFVNQLYDSKQMLGWRSTATASSGQFKVLRGGCWEKIKFERENGLISRRNEWHDLKGNPWIQHFRSSSKHPGAASPVPEDSVSSTSQLQLCAEMTDQNFVDEEVECEKEHSRINIKRPKSLITDASGNAENIGSVAG